MHVARDNDVQHPVEARRRHLHDQMHHPPQHRHQRLLRRLRPGRWRGLSLAGLGWGAALALAALFVPPLLVLAISAAGSPPGSTLAAACALAQLPVLVAVLAICGRQPADLALPADAAVELGSRAEQAERALAREHDRVHQLRGTVVGITASYRLLHDRHVTISPGRRSRLERLHDVEMARLERLLRIRTGSPPQAVDLDAIVEPLVEVVRLRGHVVHWTGTGCSVWAQPDDVVEIVHVLLENAARHAAGRDVEVSAVPRGEVVDLRVSDQGPGIAPEVLPTLFARGARRAGSPGQGLGLDIAHRLSRQMGGHLRLEPSPPGASGAAFVLTLPSSPGGVECLGLSG